AQQEQKHILVVDDNPADLNFLRKILREEGYVVHTTIDAEQAIEFSQSSSPDLILLDVNMPGMGGYEVCEKLKAGNDTRDAPVIFISGADQVIDKVKAFSKGGVDYIVKPYHAAEILVRIRLHLSLHELQKHLGELVQSRTVELTDAVAQL